MTFSTTEYLAFGGLAAAALVVWQMRSGGGGVPTVQPPGSRNKTDGSAQGRSSEGSSNESGQATGDSGMFEKAEVRDFISITESGPEGFEAGERAMLVDQQQSDYYIGRGATGL